MPFKTLRKATTVNSGQAIAVTATPANGKKIIVTKFIGNDTSSAKASCKLVWDYDGTPESLWIINEGSPFEGEIETLEDDSEIVGDGTKKLAIVLDNGCSDAYNMSAFCEYFEEA